MLSVDACCARGTDGPRSTKVVILGKHHFKIGDRHQIPRYSDPKKAQDLKQETMRWSFNAERCSQRSEQLMYKEQNISIEHSNSVPVRL